MEDANEPQPMSRATPFSYTCNRCLRCCYNKRIQVNPYEIARLARNLGVSTTEVIKRFIDLNKRAILTRDNGGCVIFTEQGCGVHSDRPLVCRLYPLGRRGTFGNEESFIELRPHPHTEGVYGTNGTVESFLRGQDVEPHIAFAYEYVRLFQELVSVLTRTTLNFSETKERIARNFVSEERSDSGTTLMGTRGEESPSGIDGDLAVSLVIDVDYALRYLSRLGSADVPTNLEERISLHLRRVREWISTNFAGGSDER